MPDFFSIMGLPRSLALDGKLLAQRYFELSRRYHPDFHTLSDTAAREESLEMSSLLNQAFATLKDPFERARHLVTLEWPDIPDADKKSIPPALLFEVMEMQETIADAQSAAGDASSAERDAALADIERRLTMKMNALSAQLDDLASRWDIPELSADARAEVLKRLNELLNTRNYLRTLLATIDAVRHNGAGVRH